MAEEEAHRELQAAAVAADAAAQRCLLAGDRAGADSYLRVAEQRYRESSVDEPSATVDDAIRAAARREVSARPRLAGSPFSASWRIPLSIAAVVLVSVTLTLLLVDHKAHLPVAGDAERHEDDRDHPERGKCDSDEPVNQRSGHTRASPSTRASCQIRSEMTLTKGR